MFMVNQIDAVPSLVVSPQSFCRKALRSKGDPLIGVATTDRECMIGISAGNFSIMVLCLVPLASSFAMCLRISEVQSSS